MLKAFAAHAYTAMLACAVGTLFVGVPVTGHARQASAANGISTITAAELPPQGRETLALVRSGGPFPYEKDGTVFGNRERLLPAHKRGYYREYTVRTPGSRDRGVRRLVCGGEARLPDVCYYSNDHYTSFREIVE